MKKYTETEVKEARAFLEARGIVPNWFRFTRELMGNLQLLFELEERDGTNRIKDPLIPATLMYALIDYFETGEAPKYLNDLLNRSQIPREKRLLNNILENGFRAIDETYMQYFSMVKGGEFGGQKRWNHLKAQGSENESKKISFKELKNDSDDEFSFEDI